MEEQKLNETNVCLDDFCGNLHQSNLKDSRAAQSSIGSIKCPTIDKLTGRIRQQTVRSVGPRSHPAIYIGKLAPASQLARKLSLPVRHRKLDRGEAVLYIFVIYKYYTPTLLSLNNGELTVIKGCG